MNHKLLLIEGIPSAGKTTTARKIKDDLIKQGYEVNLYEEGMSHPADMSWQAVLTEVEYEEFKNKCLIMWETSEKSISKAELLNYIE